MQSALYPLKFLPLVKNVIWGGNRIKDYGFNYDPLPNCGELWVRSSVPGHESVVANGFLAENTLNEAIEVYMGDLVGDKVYNRYGTEFPLLLKVIDAARDLSIQVHPGDELAQRRGMPRGKTEMWYVMQADEGSRLISGFRRNTTPEEYTAALNVGRLVDLLHSEEPKPGEVYFIPAGRVHALGKGLMVAEIQRPPTAPTASTTTTVWTRTARSASCILPRPWTPSTSAASAITPRPATTPVSTKRPPSPTAPTSPRASSPSTPPSARTSKSRTPLCYISVSRAWRP